VGTGGEEVWYSLLLGAGDGFLFFCPCYILDFGKQGGNSITYRQHARALFHSYHKNEKSGGGRSISWVLV